MGMKVVLLVLKLCIFMVFFPVHESTGYSISPSPEIFSVPPPSEESVPSIGYHGNSKRISTPSPSPLPSGSVLHPPVVSQPHKSAPIPQPFQGLVPSIPPSSPVVVPSHKSAPMSQVVQGIVPSMPPSPPMGVPSNRSAPMPRVVQGIVPSMPPSPQVIVPSHKSAPMLQIVQGIVPSMTPSPPVVVPSNKSAPTTRVVQGIVPSMPPSHPVVVPSHKPALTPRVKGIVPSKPPSNPSHRRAPKGRIPIKVPLAPAPVELPGRKFPRKPPAMHPTMPKIAPSMVSDPAASPVSAPPSSISRKRHGIPVAAPPMFNHFPPMNTSPTKASPPHKAMRPSNNAPAPSKLSPKPAERSWIHSPASSPINSFYKYHHARKRASGPAPAPAPSFLFPPPTTNHQAPIIPPATSDSPTVHPKKRRRRHHHPVPTNHAPSVSPVEPPFPSTVGHGSPVPSAALPAPFGPSPRPVLPPKSSPSGSSPRKPKTPLPPGPPPVRALPPPPPNQDCTSITCTEPFTNSPPGSPCGCVWPMQVGLRLSVALYTFFPLVSELAEEIATGVFMKLSQVRIMGANAAGQQLDKTIVLIDLVPLGERFDNTTAFLTYEKFWRKQVLIKASYFGDYEVLYVRYPGLPPSPPSAPSGITTLDGGPYAGHGSNGRTIQPLGVDVRRKRNGGLGGSMIAILVLSCSIAVALCIIAAWLLLLKCGKHARRIPEPTPPLLIPSLAKPSGTARTGSMMFGSGPSSASMSFGSSITTYTGSAKTFSAGEIEKATDNFHASRILGEGGFGRVYRGILDDGTQVAVKVLKRDDQQGGREFLAEVEMLSRLHHRNLVKLIGICIEENARCLVYELIPNGSVESHLHGPDKETAPLDWGARVKIALGAARGLAYLHEDSSPHVIHRDFKSSNILLEHDFTPKVSDFGLARTALEEGNQHITTRVMGTFGFTKRYILKVVDLRSLPHAKAWYNMLVNNSYSQAPEYAMTGHLLVKSDVYSYGVVLLELLTGRKPVDMSQPQGQENLVAWARPFLTSKEGLEMIIDPALGSNFLFDSVAKVAAIASMCVQPEVSHRPFMGEVVQALKLVCNECDETKEAGESESCGQEDLSVVDIDTRTSTDSGQLPESSRARYSLPEYNSSLEVGRNLSASDVFSMSSRIGRQESGSFRRYSSSGPLRTGRSRPFWQRLRSLSRGSISEHGVAFRVSKGFEGYEMKNKLHSGDYKICVNWVSQREGAIHGTTLQTQDRDWRLLHIAFTSSKNLSCQVIFKERSSEREREVPERERHPYTKILPSVGNSVGFSVSLASPIHISTASHTLVISVFLSVDYSAPSAKPISSPVPDAWYPTLAFFMLAIGLVVTASFFIYEATSSKKNRSIAKELTTGAVASVFLGFGSLFLLLATGVYV
ncbi:Protein kinase domain [Macleaya cordata]|uniref:Protein kinase domain n=1 Tax=Macleaya cordata TaxID=56857 RepID=A0A200QDB7_MACCD|nr:Protein kinase domain [Macleaya cordata]